MRTTDQERGYTVRELAKMLRVSPEKVRAWIKSGVLPALNTASARCSKPRYVILPHHLEAFEQSKQVSSPAKPAKKRRKKPKDFIDYYPGD